MADQMKSVGALTDREEQVLTLLRRGLSNKEIANLLSIHEGTVKQHVLHIFKKTGARKRTALLIPAAHQNDEA